MCKNQADRCAGFYRRTRLLELCSWRKAGKPPPVILSLVMREVTTARAEGRAPLLKHVRGMLTGDLPGTASVKTGGRHTLRVLRSAANAGALHPEILSFVPSCVGDSSCHRIRCSNLATRCPSFVAAAQSMDNSRGGATSIPVGWKPGPFAWVGQDGPHDGHGWKGAAGRHGIEGGQRHGQRRQPIRPTSVVLVKIRNMATGPVVSDPRRAH
jgi:hypothetical protein